MGLGRTVALAVVWTAVVTGAFGCARMRGMREAAAPEPQCAPGQFLDAKGAPVGPAQVGALAANRAYVLIGEGHPLACDHLAQARVIERMAEAGALPAIGLEMASFDNQPVLDLFNKGYLSVDELESALKWRETVGYPFEAYRPIFETAKRLNLPLFALSAPRKIVVKAAKTGLAGLSFQERLGLPGRIIDCPPEQEAALREVFDEHHFPAKDQGGAWKHFLAVQAIWDTTMAHRALEVRVLTRRPVVILVGSGHVEYGWGIAGRLAKLDPDGSRLLIMPWRLPDPPDSIQADLFFFCPLPPARAPLGMTLTAQSTVVTVSSVTDGSPAAKAGLIVGDQIVFAQDAPVTKLFDLHQAAMKAMEQGGALRLHIRRNGQTQTINIPLSPDK